MEICEPHACWYETLNKEKTKSIQAPVAGPIPARDPETIALACRARLAGVTRSWGVAFNELVENSKADPDDKHFCPSVHLTVHITSLTISSTTSGWHSVFTSPNHLTVSTSPWKMAWISLPPECRGAAELSI